jgi:hypothetical protein
MANATPRPPRTPFGLPCDCLQTSCTCILNSLGRRFFPHRDDRGRDSFTPSWPPSPKSPTTTSESAAPRGPRPDPGSTPRWKAFALRGFCNAIATRHQRSSWHADYTFPSRQSSAHISYVTTQRALDGGTIRLLLSK